MMDTIFSLDHKGRLVSSNFVHQEPTIIKPHQSASCALKDAKNALILPNAGSATNLTVIIFKIKTASFVIQARP